MFRTFGMDTTLGMHPPAESDGEAAPRDDATHAALGALPPALRQPVLDRCEKWIVPAGRLLLPQDQRADACYGLGAGLLRLQRGEPHGRPVVAALLEPGRWIACTHILADAPLPFSVATVTRSTLLVLRKSVLRDLLERRPEETAAWLATHAAAQSDSLVAHLGMLATGSIEQRLTWLLRLLAERSAECTDGFRRITVRLTQSEMGCIVGASRQRVNKAVGVLLQQGRLRADGPWLEIDEGNRER